MILNIDDDLDKADIKGEAEGAFNNVDIKRLK
jgi:hypothetical protein